ncbi:MAG: helix-turn-helix domain-containing protein [Spirochaetales bacterium]|jgi:cytoskeleton protein RodZ|nr:helix-turn-helix domain-containing protein [Spirochaetales bacterium]
MESIGDKLKNQREQKGYSIEQIARDTNIAKRYLEALETEDFSVFPGDPYLIGFLRNYADYLGIDPEEMVSLYRNFQIQSQPVPMDELLITRNRKPLYIGLVAAVVVAALAVGGYYLIPRLFDGRAERRAAAAELENSEETAAGAVYELEDEMVERRFEEKDIVAISYKDERYEIRLSEIAESLTLTVPGGTNVLRVGDERAIDLDGDAKMDIKVSLTDIDASAKIRTAVLRFDRFVKSASQAAQEETPAESTETDDDDKPLDSGTPALESRTVEAVQILESSSASPFSVNIEFRGYCLLRYLIDGGEREEGYFNTRDTVVLDVTREITLWISNAGSLITRISGENVEFGLPGQVSVKKITWVRDEESGKEKLLMQAVY